MCKLTCTVLPTNTQSAAPAFCLNSVAFRFFLPNYLSNYYFYITVVALSQPHSISNQLVCGLHPASTFDWMVVTLSGPVHGPLGLIGRTTKHNSQLVHCSADKHFLWRSSFSFGLPTTLDWLAYLIMVDISICSSS